MFCYLLSEHIKGRCQRQQKNIYIHRFTSGIKPRTSLDIGHTAPLVCHCRFHICQNVWRYKKRHGVSTTLAFCHLVNRDQSWLLKDWKWAAVSHKFIPLQLTNQLWSACQVGVGANAALASIIAHRRYHPHIHMWNLPVSNPTRNSRWHQSLGSGTSVQVFSNQWLTMTLSIFKYSQWSKLAKP